MRLTFSSSLAPKTYSNYLYIYLSVSLCVFFRQPIHISPFFSPVVIHYFIVTLLYMVRECPNSSGDQSLLAINYRALNFLGFVTFFDRLLVQGEPFTTRSVSEYFVLTSIDGINYTYILGENRGPQVSMI